MARNVAVDLKEAWRAVVVFRDPVNGKIWYEYEGIYNLKSTAQGRISYHKKNSRRFYNGWVEKADIHWNKVQD